MTMQQAVLGIDIGTSGTKVIVVGVDGTVLGSATETYDMATPKLGWAEQNPEDWWNATVKATQRALEKKTNLDVQAIGFSGQMHGLVPLNRDGEVLRPSIIWCDVRTEEQSIALEQTVGREQIIQLTQNPPLPNFTLTKLLWMRDYEPDLYRQIRCVLLPKDYIRYKLTGSYAMDVADASGTLLFDVSKRKWSSEMCQATGVSKEWLPPVYESNDVVGHLTDGAGALLGLPGGIPVVAGAGDQAAGAIGLGVLEPGAISAVFGTSGVVLAVTDSPLRDPKGRLHTFCHGQRDSWFVMGVTQAAGGSLQWYRNRFAQVEQLAANQSKRDVYEFLMDEAESVAPGAEGLLFLPYLLGERTPHLDPNARGGWIGLQWRHDLSHLVRSVLEGVSFSLRDAWEIIRELGITSSQWKASGGGAQGDIWMQIFASVVRQELEIVQASHGPAYGAAILAAQGVGILDETSESVHSWLSSGKTVRPKEEWVEFYDSLYSVFRQGYAASKDIVTQLNQLSR
ncbi:xylulokinase [Alicyclobacillus sp. SO9]|uniref:xylulokinase n=1 Tax=Alicyclobacillus sp. SO9 TaxID=2665646 RepID=UPI0018E813F0|nr:xylulokinase [Alicyclobacillus sp. SO9]QQE77899.1 xylulokinase [Alicyclobacillus sp. SO9]